MSTVIDDIRYIERGYEDFPAKLQSLGAQIEKGGIERDLEVQIKDRFELEDWLTTE